MNAHYMGTTSSAPTSGESPNIQLDWWSGFSDPTLTHVVSLALAQNLDIAQAGARLAQSRAMLGAATAARLPTISAQGQTGRAYQSVETPLGQVLQTTPDYNRYGNSYEMDLSASWELDLFGGLQRDREAALAEYQASHAGVAATRLAVAAASADLYVQIRGLQARIDIARKQVSTQEDLLATVRLLHSRGLAAERQVNQTQGALSEVRASLPALEASLDVALNALDVMLGAPPGTYRIEIAEGASALSVPHFTTIGSPAELLRRRPDLIVAERRLAASNARVGAALAEYYPKFSLSALLGSATAVSGANVFSSGASQFSGVLGLRWRLFDFGRIDAQIEQARGREAEMLAAYRLAALHATEDVENAFSTLIKRKEQAAVLSTGTDSLTRARGASFAAYQSGVVSLIEVLQADEQMLRSSDAMTQAQTQSLRAAISAYKALGGGWDARAI